MPNYQNGKIYAIRSYNTNMLYIGATCQKLSMRLAGHKSISNKCKSKLIIDLGDAYIELLENYPCNSREELNARERYYIRHVDYNTNVVNIGGNRDGLCSHNRLHNHCKECGGSSICPHKKLKNECKECKGAGVCTHGKLRKICYICNPVFCPCSKRHIAKGLWSPHEKTDKHKKFKEVNKFFEIDDSEWLYK